MDAAVDPATLLQRLAEEVTLRQSITQSWPIEQRAVADQLKDAIEALHREALLRLVKALRAEPAASAVLKQAARDPIVFGVLRLHGIVRDPLEARVRAALESVGPMLAEHGGGVELVALLPPDTVEVRLTGSCRSCPASGTTLSEGVERAIKEHAPEIVTVRTVQRASAAAGEPVPMHFVSPFAKAADMGFVDVCALDALPLRTAQARQVRGRSLLFYRDDTEISCVANACAHLGMPLDDGNVADGILQCAHHGFRYVLRTGECLDVPEVQLVVHAVRVRDGRVAVKLQG
jgi:nitrite reductase/ring-hydroxylating ferredoxin subunit/Fe-S cluster biogenesis protein NfuA